jgi:hypothetical protein
MNEQDLKHGGKLRHPLIHWWKRFKRPSYSKHISKRKLIGGASIVNWSVPYSSPHGEIKNQQQSDSCGGMAGAYFIEIMNLLQGKSIEISAKSIYAPIACSGGGTTEDALETQIAARGANLEATVPDVAPDGTCTEAFMSDKSWITPALLEEAATRAGYTPMSVSMDIDSIAEAIANEGAVIWLIKGQNNGTWLSAYPNPPINNLNNWGHFMCPFGYQTVAQQQIDSLQSWGTSVGDGGIQHFTSNYINSGYIVDAFTFVSDAKIVPVKGNTSIWAWLVDLWNGKPVVVPSV